MPCLCFDSSSDLLLHGLNVCLELALCLVDRGLELVDLGLELALCLVDLGIDLCSLILQLVDVVTQIRDRCINVSIRGPHHKKRNRLQFCAATQSVQPRCCNID